MPRRQNHAGHQPFSRLRNRIRVASHAQCANERGRRLRSLVRFGPVAREAIERSEPDTAVAITEKELGVPRRKTARGGEVVQGCGLGVQSVHAMPACHINPPPIVLSQGEYVLARKPLFQAVALDPWFGRRGMVHPPDATLAGSNPQSSLAFRKKRIDRTAGNLVGEDLTAESAKTN